ncbi:MAG TPA: amidohydrolase family protein [Chloroflexota bacterium]|nr:amidohydrolase family protein [Chloroflexota bacterium]
MSTPTTLPNETARRTDEILVSGDSHVTEAPDFWATHLPGQFRDQAPVFGGRPNDAKAKDGRPGGSDPHARLEEMQVDGVSAEVLYPTYALRLFGLDDARLQEACFRLYNDWLIEYCQVDTNRLVGIPCIAIYDVDHAVAELERCRKAGLQGALIWQAPHPDLPFYSDHYDRFWAAAQDLDAPVSLHILTGHNYSKTLDNLTIESYRGSVNLKTADAANALFDFIFYGILERYPRLKLVVVENEIGWLPFTLQQWDYYYHRFVKVNPPPITMPPSAYFDRQIFASFFNDAVGTRLLDNWGQDNCMWSNDYPHANSTWPHSRDVIARHLGHLPADVRAKLVRGNCLKLYQLSVPELAQHAG